MPKGAIKLRVMRAYSEKTVPSLIRLGTISPNAPYMLSKYWPLTRMENPFPNNSSLTEKDSVRKKLETCLAVLF